MLSLPVECLENARLTVSCNSSELRTNDSDRTACRERAGRKALAERR